MDRELQPKLKSITVASPKSKVGGGRPCIAKYCYGSGATVVVRGDQERHTAEFKEGVEESRDNNKSSISRSGTVSMGLKSSTGG